jgi:hypothetical protein
MKKLVIALLLVQGIAFAQKPCPPWGSAKKGTLAYTLNLKKNRIKISETCHDITILGFLKLPDDSTGDQLPYHLSGGYVIAVKKQGKESCNCKSKTDRDFHIVVVPDPKDAGNKAKYVIVEVTPGIQRAMKWKDQEIQDLKDHYVDFYGWKFADLEHKNMSVKSNPERKTCWRGTINEIHPITGFKVVEKH